MLIDVGKTSYAVQQEGKASILRPTQRLASRRTAFWLVPPASSLFSLRPYFQRFLFGSASPLLLLVLIILMAFSCSRGSSSIVSSPVADSKSFIPKIGSLSKWGVKDALKPFSCWSLVGKEIKALPGHVHGKDGRFKHVAGCGTITCLYICGRLVCSKPHYGARKCLKRDCPICYPTWLIRSSDSITARLLSKRSLGIHENLRLVEADLSIPVEKYPTSMADFKVLRKEANAYALSIGFVGGFMVPHQFRTTEHAKDMAHEEGKAKWDWVRDQEDWQAHTRLSYHFHVIGFITWLKKQEKGYKEWQYGSVTDQNNSPIDLLKEPNPEKRLKGRCKYLIGHTAIPKEEAAKYRAFNYFGSCSYNKFGITEEEREAVRTGEPPVRYCKLCSSELLPAWAWIKRYYGAIQNGEFDEPEFFNEIQDFMSGASPPEDAKKFLVDAPSDEGEKGG